LAKGKALGGITFIPQGESLLENNLKFYRLIGKEILGKPKGKVASKEVHLEQSTKKGCSIAVRKGGAGYEGSARRSSKGRALFW